MDKSQSFTGYLDSTKGRTVMAHAQREFSLHAQEHNLPDGEYEADLIALGFENRPPQPPTAVFNFVCNKQKIKKKISVYTAKGMATLFKELVKFGFAAFSTELLKEIDRRIDTANFNVILQLATSDHVQYVEIVKVKNPIKDDITAQNGHLPEETLPPLPPTPPEKAPAPPAAPKPPLPTPEPVPELPPAQIAPQRDFDVFVGDRILARTSKGMEIATIISEIAASMELVIDINGRLEKIPVNWVRTKL